MDRQQLDLSTRFVLLESARPCAFGRVDRRAGRASLTAAVLERAGPHGTFHCCRRVLQEAIGVQQEVDARPRRQRRQALQQLERIEEEMRWAVRPAMPQLEDDLPLRRQVRPVLRDWRAKGVPAQALESGPIARRHDDSRVQIEPVVARVARPEP